MRNYYAEDVSAHIEHYGVVGMRWGTRRANRQAMKSSIKSARQKHKSETASNFDKLMSESGKAGDAYRASKKAAVAQRKAGNKGQVKKYVKSALTLKYKDMSDAANTIKTNNRKAKAAKQKASEKFDRDFDAVQKRSEKRTSATNAKADNAISKAKSNYKSNKGKISATDAAARGVDKKTADRINSNGHIKTAVQARAFGSYGALKYNESRANGSGRVKAATKGIVESALNGATLGGRANQQEKKNMRNTIKKRK